MNSEDCCKIMEEAGVKPTSIRILVYKTISTLNNTFNLNDIETLLPSVDKSSIFRVLRTFHKNNLIHSIDDGSGSQKYCFCHKYGSCKTEDRHCHFYCETCKKTYCFENDLIPSIVIPNNFKVKEINYIIKGICPECRKHHEQ